MLLYDEPTGAFPISEKLRGNAKGTTPLADVGGSSVDIFGVRAA